MSYRTLTPLLAGFLFATGVAISSRPGFSAGGEQAAGAAIGPPAPQRQDRLNDEEPLPDGAIVRLGSTRYRSPLPIADTAISSDGRLLAIQDAGQHVRLLDCATGKVRSRLLLPASATCPVFSPDGRSVAVISDGRAREWEIENGTERPVEYETFNKQVESLEYSKANELLAAAVVNDDAAGLRIVNLSNGKELGKLPTTVAGETFTLSPDGKRALTSHSDGWKRKATLWDVTRGLEIASRNVPGNDLPLVAFMANGTPIAITTDNNGSKFANAPKKRLQVLDVASGDVVYESVEGNDLECLGAAADADRIAVRKSAVSDSGRRMDFLSVRKLSTGAEVFRTAAVAHALLGPARISADGRIVVMRASGDRGDIGRMDHSVTVWDVAARQRLDADLEGHRAAVRSIMFSPDGKLLASASRDGGLRLWDVLTGHESSVLTNTPVNGRGIAISPDGALVAATCGGFYQDRSSIGVWSVQPVKAMYTLPVAYISDSSAVSFSADGKYLATGARLPRGGWMISGLDDARSYGGIEVWDCDELNRFPFRAGPRSRLEDATPAKEFHTRGALSGHTEDVNCVGFSPDATILASAGADQIGRGALSLWKLPGGELIREIKRNHWYVGHLAFSPNGKRVATTSSYTMHETQSFQPQAELARGRNESRGKIIELWNVEDGTVARSLEGHSADIGGIAFSPDGRHLASASLDGTVGVWRLSDATLITRLKGHSGGVLSVAFAADGKILASGSTDTTILIWDFARVVSQAD